MSLINEEEVNKRLNSPLNLINKMRNGMKPDRKNAMSLFVRPTLDVPKEVVVKKVREVPVASVEQKKLETSDVVDDADTKIKLALAHDNALKLTNKAIETLTNKLDDVSADKIPSVISAANKVVESIRKERIEKDKNYRNDQHVHHHFYMPEQRKIEEYEVIEVTS